MDTRAGHPRGVYFGHGRIVGIGEWRDLGVEFPLVVPQLHMLCCPRQSPKKGMCLQGG